MVKFLKKMFTSRRFWVIFNLLLLLETFILILISKNINILNLFTALIGGFCLGVWGFGKLGEDE